MTNPSAPAIRTASRDDATAIAKIKVAAWRVAYRKIVPDIILDGLDIDDVRENWFGLSKSGLDRGGVVAARDGRIVGYVLFGTARNGLAGFDGQIFEIYVLPDQFGSGLGSRLHDAAMSRLEADGHANILLWVFEANARARRFYEKHGWTPIENAMHVTEIGGARLHEVAYGFRLPNRIK